MKKVIIVIQNGVVCQVYTDAEMDVHVVDYDAAEQNDVGFDKVEAAEKRLTRGLTECAIEEAVDAILNEEDDEEDVEDRREEFEAEAGYPLSDNQLRFCVDCEEQGLELNYTYSGRAMYGEQCPSVVGTQGPETKADYLTDNMGREFVYYARF